MIIIQPLKLHYYSYRKSYLTFYIISFLLAALAIYFVRIDNIDTIILLSFITATIIFTIVLGIYEYNRLVYDYIYLKIHYNEFYFSSLIHALINASIQLLASIVVVVIINSNPTIENLMIPVGKVLIYLVYFVTNVLLFILSSLLTVIFRRVKYIRYIITIILLVLIAIFFYDILELIRINFYSIFNNIQILIQVLFFELALIIISSFSLYLVFKIIRK